MANRLILTVIAVAAFAVICEAFTAAHQQHKAEMKEAKERHWNKTVTKIVEVETKIADKVEDVLNKTAAKVMETKQKINAIKDEMKIKLAAKAIEESNKWAELKNKAAEKMAESKAKAEAVKEMIQAKVAAGVVKVAEKATEVIQFKTAAVAKVVDKMQQVKASFHEKKEEKRNKTITESKRVSPVPVKIVSLPESSFSPLNSQKNNSAYPATVSY